MWNGLDAGEHGHGHSHGHGHGHDHDHDDDPERGLERTLLDCIDLPRVRCLNATESDGAARVFRPWHTRHDRSAYVDSDADAQLIVYIPFTEDVKLKSICIIGGDGDAHPSLMRAYKNRDDIDFDNVEQIPAEQQWALVEDPEGRHPYETLIAKFSGLHSLTLYFKENFGGDSTRLYFIGLRGESKSVHRRTLITVAEVAARPEDHTATIKANTEHKGHFVA